MTKTIRVWARESKPWTLIALDRPHPGSGRVFDVVSGDRVSAFRVLRSWLLVPKMARGCACCSALLVHFAADLVGAVTEIPS